ncbi:KR domain-containing protein [Micromonospora sp. b486]|uniref:KR domain-containing protein n=1 Tax=Micromonospora sp. b486 TaxID=3053986 RepID=UPI00338FE5A5
MSRHLVSTYGVRHLILTSRRGRAAGGVAELCAELEALGVSVTVGACDVADRAAVAELLAGIPAEHPLTAVIPRRRRPRRRRHLLAHTPSGWTACCGPRSTPRGTCTS